MVGGGNNGGTGGFWQGCAKGGQKNGGHLVNKQGQRRDVQTQRRNVLEDGCANVATLRSNVATFQRGYKSNVATLGSNVTTFQRMEKMTSQR